MWSAPARITARPAFTLPISATLATPGWLASAAPVAPSPVTTEKTPGGNRSPASSAIRSADSGACSGGLTMTALPAARAEAGLPAQNMNGWLNGMMRTTTPSGSRTEKLTTPGPIGTDAPFISVTRPAKKSSCATAVSTSLRSSRTGLPPSIGVDPGQLVAAGGQAAGHLAQHAGALERGDAAPLGEAGPRRGHGPVHVLGAGHGEAPQRLAGGRADGRRGAPGGLMPPAAVEQVAVSGQLELAHAFRSLRPGRRALGRPGRLASSRCDVMPAPWWSWPARRPARSWPPSAGP